jgi:hypothetical protein
MGLGGIVSRVVQGVRMDMSRHGPGTLVGCGDKAEVDTWDWKLPFPIVRALYPPQIAASSRIGHVA